jgi:hypothetical protein
MCGRQKEMRVVLRGIHRVTKVLASGQRATYFYAWRRGPRLTGQPESPEFVAAFTKAHADRKKPASGSLASLVAEFRNSAEFAMLSPATRRDYLRYLGMIETEFGDVPLKALEDRRIRGDFREWRDRMSATPRKADLAWAVLARVLSVAKDRGRISVNACERGGRLSKPNRVDFIWTEDLIDRL